MTVRSLIKTAKNIYKDEESYNDLWNAIATLRNLGLIEEKFSKTFVEVVHELEQGR